MFYRMEEKVISFNSSLLDEFLPLLEIDIENILTCQDPPDFDQISAEDPDQRYVKLEFAALIPPSIPKVEVHASNESTMSDYYEFV